MPRSPKQQEDVVDLIGGQLDVAQRLGDAVAAQVALLAPFDDELPHFIARLPDRLRSAVDCGYVALCHGPSRRRGWHGLSPRRGHVTPDLGSSGVMVARRMPRPCGAGLPRQRIMSAKQAGNVAARRKPTTCPRTHSAASRRTTGQGRAAPVVGTTNPANRQQRAAGRRRPRRARSRGRPIAHRTRRGQAPPPGVCISRWSHASATSGRRY